MSFVSGVYCDKCNRQLCFAGIIGKSSMTYIARKKGWQIGKYCTCPQCVAKKGADQNG